LENTINNFEKQHHLRLLVHYIPVFEKREYMSTSIREANIQWAVDATLSSHNRGGTLPPSAISRKKKNVSIGVFLLALEGNDDFVVLKKCLPASS
jgi:hypothetical protein